MSWQAPNLASQPFLNLRPLRRTAWTLAAAAFLLTAWNVVSYVRAGAGTVSRVAKLEKLETETAAARRKLATIDHGLAAIDLAAENQRAEFLNERIEERSFSWNELFDRLAATLPDGVRLRSLAPKVVSRKERTGHSRSAATTGGERPPVELTIRGEAEGDDELLAFVDRLFADPAFESPSLHRESREAGGVAFDLTARYRPGGNS